MHTQLWSEKLKRPLIRPRRRREDNIRMDLWEIKWKCVNWTRMAQDRPLAACCECVNKSSGSTKGGKFD
jgi:hypothetical protein